MTAKNLWPTAVILLRFGTATYIGITPIQIIPAMMEERQTLDRFKKEVGCDKNGYEFFGQFSNPHLGIAIAMVVIFLLSIC